MVYSHSSIQGVVPPYIFREIVAHGVPVQQERARRTLEMTEGFRAKRIALKAGETLAHTSMGPGPQRRVYDAHQGSVLPGELVLGEGEPPAPDQAVNEAYQGVGATYRLYCDVFGRNSVDDRGARLDATVHYMKGYDNAFWNGKQMVFGDGDEDLPPEKRLFNRFTAAEDIIGHEISHGIVQYEANLLYANQPGALNESMADVFGILVKQYRLGQSAAEAGWVIGNGLFTENVKGEGIRSMSAPGTAYDDPVLGKDPQPAHMRDYQHVTYDDGGVHINSGIPNHAFYLAAMEMGGYAWERAGRIWYVTLRDKLLYNSGFQAAAQLTYNTAGELFGRGSLEQQAVRAGWAGVGIYLPGETAASPGCLPALLGLLAPRRSR